MSLSLVQSFLDVLDHGLTLGNAAMNSTNIPKGEQMIAIGAPVRPWGMIFDLELKVTLLR